jgi:MFS family permease
MNKQLIILLIGRIITNFADSFYMIATIWYVKTVTNSPLLIGVTSAVAILPITIQFIYGPIIDRFPKRKILYAAMMGQGLLVSIMALLYLTNFLWLPVLYILMFLALSLSECTYPTESALIERLSTREELTKVNSIFSFSYHTLDIICDAISGILIIFIGLGTVYLANSVLLVGTGFIFLVYLKVPKTKKESTASTIGFLKQYKEDFLDGFNVVKNRKVLLSMMFGIIGVNVFATMGIAMLPVISSTSAEYGFWLTAMSIGTLTGTVLSSKVDKFPLNRIMPTISVTAGFFWLLSFLLIEVPLVPYIFFGIAWVSIGVLGIYVQTMIQVNLPEEYIGIGFAFISSLLGSLSPLGYFIGGLFGELLSGSVILLISGLGYLGFAAYFLLHPKLNKLTNRLNVSFERPN